MQSISTKSKDERIKADIIGPDAHSGRFPAMSAVARAPYPGEGWRSHTWMAIPTPLAVIADLPPFKGVPEGRGIKDPRSHTRKGG